MKYFKYISVLLFYIFISCSDNSIVNIDEVNNNTPPYIAEDIRKTVESVNIDSLKTYLEILTGAAPFINGSDTVVIKSRNSFYEENEIAADYLESKLKGFGYTVINQNFNSNGRNIYAVLNGSGSNNEYYVICAHYDSMPESIISPGADDNGSGTSVVIEAARVFAGLNPKANIIFAFWDEEEIGLLGSKYFAEMAFNNSIKIIGVINVDMIGWDSNNDNYLMLSVPNPDINYPIVTAAEQINEGMNLGLQIGVINSQISSDHVSFLKKGFIAYCFIEDRLDFNGFYHSTNDRIQFINFPYYNKNCKLIIGVLALLTL